jgi:hypothetical protein
MAGEPREATMDRLDGKVATVTGEGDGIRPARGAGDLYLAGNDAQVLTGDSNRGGSHIVDGAR